MNFVVMGIDRIGKNTFIENVLKTFDPDLKEIHLSKPPADVDPLMYTKAEYAEYFMELKKNNHLVYNRGHIDEFVYGPLYRDQNTYWLKIYEQELWDVVLNTVFILLISENFNVMQDDGNSLDYSRRHEEQDLFLKHFQESPMKNKIIIRTIDRNGYRPIESIKDDFSRELMKIIDKNKSQTVNQ